MKENSNICLPKSSITHKLHEHKKKIFSALLFILLAALTFYAVCKGNDMEQAAAAIRRMDIGYIIGAAALGIFFVASEGLMIWYLLHALGSHPRMAQCIKYSFIGFFFSGITPSATGGQPAQLYHMKKDGHKMSESTVVLMTVAVVYKFVLVVIGLLLLLCAYRPLREYLGHYIWLYYLGLLLNVILVTVLLMVMFLPGIFKTIVFWAEKLCVKLHILKASKERRQRLEGFIDSYHETVHFFLHNKRKIAAVIGFTVLQRMSVFLLTYLVYLGFHLTGTDAFTVVMLQASVYIAVDMLPLPGAQGITELMYKSIFGTVFTGSYLAASMCVTRGINFYLLLILSALVTLTVYVTGRVHKMSAQARSCC